MLPILESGQYYVEWKDDLKIWQSFTVLNKAKQGLSLYFILTGLARDSVWDLTTEDIFTLQWYYKYYQQTGQAVFKRPEKTCRF